MAEISEEIGPSNPVPFPINAATFRPTIFRAPIHMRYRRTPDFEPKFVSIGPYFHGNKNLRAMENQKRKFALDLMNKVHIDHSGIALNIYVQEFSSFEQPVRAFYRESTNITVTDQYDSFLLMLFLDSCFIIRVIMAISQGIQESGVFPGADIKEVRSDLLLLENQIPLFFINQVYTSFQRAESERETKRLPPLLKLLEPFICLDMPWKHNSYSMSLDVSHLLDLYWRCCLPFYITMPNSLSESSQSQGFSEQTSWAELHLQIDAIQVIPNATELYRVYGVAFRKKSYRDGFGVSFENGVMQIPRLKMDPSRTTLLANLIAFENCMLPTIRVLTSYVALMDALIDTERDVELLQTNGIIHNMLSSNKMAATFFNDIGNICVVDYKSHYFSQLYEDVQKYCDSPTNKILASLHHNYFSNPWSGISVGAAAVLLVLSGLQTYYTVYGYYHNHS